MRMLGLEIMGTGCAFDLGADDLDRDPAGAVALFPALRRSRTGGVHRSRQSGQRESLHGNVFDRGVDL